MRDQDLSGAVPEEVRRTIIEALSALHREHASAYRIACRLADKAGAEPPIPDDYRMFDLADLARRFGGEIH